MPFTTKRKAQLAQVRPFANRIKRRKLSEGEVGGYKLQWIEQTGDEKLSNTVNNPCTLPTPLPQSNCVSNLTRRASCDSSSHEARGLPGTVSAPESTRLAHLLSVKQPECVAESLIADSAPEVLTVGQVADVEHSLKPECVTDVQESSDHNDRPILVSPRHQLASCTRAPPSRDDAAVALRSLNKLLYPRRETGAGYKRCKLDVLTRTRCEAMTSCLRFYLRSSASFICASNQAAIGADRGIWYARRIRARVQQFVSTGKLPVSKYGRSHHSMLEDEDFANEISLFLQKKGKHVVAEDIVRFLSDPEDEVSLAKRTNRPVLRRHERGDVVEYRQNEYAPKMKALEPFFLSWDEETGAQRPTNLPAGQRPVSVWFHDSSTFFAHDRRTLGWFKLKNKHLQLAKKGQGVSVTVADFVSAESGFLKSRDGTSCARKTMLAGTGRDGYLTNDDICAQFELAVNIVKREYPDRDHVFVYDNARIHTKRPATAPSARLMPKGESDNFGATIVTADGKSSKARMQNPRMPDGSTQEPHPPNGKFKGIAELLRERGYNASQLKAQCTKFKLIDLKGGQRSNLELLAEQLGTQVIFLPKFHCELNPIEQCWGYAKRLYRMAPPSSLTADVEKNMVNALNRVPLNSIRRFFLRSRRFVDAYAKGLDGPNIAASEWARRKMLRHRASPEHISM